MCDSHNHPNFDCSKPSKRHSDTRKRLKTLMGFFGTCFQYGYIPVIIYLGIRKGADPGCPEVTLKSLLWM